MADGCGDAVQVEVGEGIPDHRSGGVSGVSAAPVLGVDGVAELAGSDAAEGEPEEADDGRGMPGLLSARGWWPGCA
jgi:hypothetical protein